jgi:hypothetical protein
MDDDEKAALARQGMNVVNLAKPGAIAERVKGSVKDAAGNAALRGIAALGRLAGKTPERSPARAIAVAAVDVNIPFDHWNAGEAADFDQRLAAFARSPRLAAEAMPSVETLQEPSAHLSELRRSFPPEAQKLALLIFNCVDLLEELADDVEGSPPSPAELERKEQLLTRIADLIEPKAGEALSSFVAHVVALSREARSEAR